MLTEFACKLVGLCVLNVALSTEYQFPGNMIGVVGWSLALTATLMNRQNWKDGPR